MINYKEERDRTYSTLTVIAKDSRKISNENTAELKNNSLEESRLGFLKTKNQGSSLRKSDVNTIKLG